MNEHYQQLIIQYSEGTITDAGLNELRDWLEQDHRHQAMFRETLKVLEESKRWFAEPEPASKEKAWSRIENEISKKERFRNNRLLGFKYYAAASLVFLLSVAAAWFSLQKKDRYIDADYVYFHNSKGKRSKIILPDQSVVYLNAESSIRFLKHFENLREIELGGEAFFEVTHDEERPFVVNSGAVKTTVLGTTFNIKAFPQERKVWVTVASGKVGVSTSSPDGQKFLQYLLPGQQLNINTLNGDYAFSSTNVADVLAWKDSKLIFDNSTLDEIAVLLSRWYNINTALTAPGNSRSAYTAKFDNLPLKEVLDIISQLSGCRYTLQHNKLIIDNKNCK